MEDELHTVVYRSDLEVQGQKLPILTVLDDSIYSVVHVIVSHGTVNDENRAAVVGHLNDLNKRFKVFKYYLNENDDICLDSCLPSTAEKFDAQLLLTVIVDVILRHLETDKEYANLMKVVWQN